MSRFNVNGPTDAFFQSADFQIAPDGRVAQVANGSCELVQNWRSLTGLTQFQGELFSLNMSSQLQRRKLYVGLIFDDWTEFRLAAHVNLMLNNGVVATFPIRHQYPPCNQSGPFDLCPITAIPATNWDRIAQSSEFVDMAFWPEELVENELRGALRYSRHDDSGFIYFFRLSPLHVHVMANKMQFQIDQFLATPTTSGGGDNDGVAMCLMAALSQRFGGP